MRRSLSLSASLTALAYAGFAFSGAAWAQASATATPSPDLAGQTAANAPVEVVVVATRSAELLDKVGASVTVLTLPQIRADQELVISDIIARTPGVSFVRNGGVGGTTSVSIRGADTDQTVVLIDGVQLNDPSSPSGGFDFSSLLTSDISRIEVLRGPQSTLYGSQAMGGVVNIVTADPTKPFEGDAQVEGGSYGTGYAKLGLGGHDGAWTWRVAGSAYATSGISAFDKAFGGKEDDGYRNQALTARVAYAFTPDVSLDLRGFYVQSRAKFDGFSTPTFNFGDDAEFGATRQTVLYSGLNFGLFDDRLRNRLAAQYTLIQRDSYDPADAPIAQTFDGRGTNARIEYQGVYSFAPGWLGTFGAQSERSSIAVATPAFNDPASPSYFPPGSPPVKSDVTINSAYGQLQAEVIPGLNLTGGLRYDDHSTFGGHTTGQASAAWALNGGATILRASYGRAFKAPSLYQLYSAYGNTTLAPEQSNGWDGGVEQKFWDGRIDLQATAFIRETTDLINFVSCFSTTTPQCSSGRFGYYDNVAKAKAHGVELSGAVHPLAGLDITANYTFTDSEDRSPGSATFGKFLARKPEDLANLGVSYVWPFKLTTGVAIRYAGSSFDNAANTSSGRLKSYTLTDLRASYPLGHGLEVYGRVENLFDKAYETAYQYGSLGRAGYLGVRAAF